MNNIKPSTRYLSPFLWAVVVVSGLAVGIISRYANFYTPDTFIIFLDGLLILLVYSLIVLYKPELSLQIMLLSIPFGKIITLPLSGGSPDLLYTDVFLFMILIFWVIEGLALKKLIVFKNPLYLPIALYLTLSSISLLWLSRNNSLAIALYRSILSGFLAYFLVVNLLKTQKQLRFFILTFPLWGVILSGVTLVYVAVTQPDFWGALFLNKDAVRVTWGKNNYLAAFWALIIPLTISISLNYRGLRRWLVISSAIVMLSTLVLSGSRGGFASLAIVLLLYLLLLGPKVAWGYKLALLALLAGVVSINPAISPLLRRFGYLANNITNINAGTIDRLGFWRGSWQAFTKSPLWGVGLDNVGFYIEDLTGIFIIHPHNYILKVLSETGLIGLGLVGWMFFLIFKNLIFLRKKSKFDYYWNNLAAGFTASFSVAVLHSMVEPTFVGVQYSILFWSMVGATFAMRNVLAIKENS